MADEEGYEVAIKATRTVMRFLGIWPNLYKRNENWLSRSRFIVPAFFIFSFINVPQTALLIKVWGNFNEVLNILITANIPNFIALIKLLSVWYNKKGLLLISMEDDWKCLKSLTESRIMLKNAKLARLITLVTYTLSVGTYVLYLYYIHEIESKKQAKITLNNGTKLRPLYANAYFFYDVQKSPVYEIVYILQMIGMASTVFSFMSVDSLFTVLVFHLCGQLINLQQRLKNITKMLVTTGRRNFSYQLSTMVLRHDELNRFAQAIEMAFNTMFLVQMLLSCMVLCLQGFQIVIVLTSDDTIPVIELVFMIYYTLNFAFSLFVYCYVAEHLRTESTEIGNAAYQSKWYDLPVHEARLFILTMSRSTTPFEITAGKFAAFSLEFYCSILKTSGGYISMLLAVKDRLAD